MLLKSGAIYQGNQSLQDELSVTGRDLTKTGLTFRDRARLAAAIVDGRVRVDDLTITQAAALCRVSVPHVKEARRVPGRPRESLTQMFARSSSAERRAMARSAGVDLIWDQCIEPLIAE